MQYAGAQTAAQGAQVQAQAQSAAALYQAQIARNNMKVAGYNARYALEAGNSQAEQVEIAGQQKQGSLIAAQAANGVDVNTGSAVKVQQGQAMASQLSAENVIANAQLTSYGYRTQRQQFALEGQMENQAAAYDVQGGNLAAQGYQLQGEAGLLGSASSIGFKFGSIPTSLGTTPFSSNYSSGGLSTYGMSSINSGFY